jgi:TfoX/Sxy family transcriptional regulator of competence genes
VTPKALDDALAARVRARLAGAGEIAEIAMFGGRKFSVDGTMVCGVVRGALVVRVGPSAHDAALAEPHTRPMDFTGRPLRGLVFVDAPGTATDAGLDRWLAAGLEGARAHPTTGGKARRRQA